MAQAGAVPDHEARGQRHRRCGDQRVEQAERCDWDRCEVVENAQARLPWIVFSVLRANPIAAATTHRSSRTMIRSAALIATSVPEPTARPRSAAANAGASFTPSPTIATHRPSCLQAPDDRDLLRGQRAGHDLGDPDRRAYCPGCRLVVSRQKDAAQSERLQPAHRGRGGGPDRVGDGKRTDHAAIAANDDNRSPEALPLDAAIGQIGRAPGRARRRRPARVRHRARVPRTMPCAPIPGSATNESTSGSPPTQCSATRGDGTRDRMLGRRAPTLPPRATPRAARLPRRPRGRRASSAPR